jgi:beta-galactosidase/beta-glucuronidase
MVLSRRKLSEVLTPTQTSNGIQFDFNKFTFPQSVDLSGNVLMRWDGMFQYFGQFGHN